MTAKLLEGPQKRQSRPRQWPNPLASEVELADFAWPEGYCNNVVAQGYIGKNDAGQNTNYLNKLHVVKPNGKLACGCAVKPGISTFNYLNVQIPVDFRDLLCQESAEYLRSEITRLQQERK